MSASPWMRMLLVAGSIGALLVVLRAWQRKYSPNPELARKLAREQWGIALVAVAIATLLFNSTQPSMEDCPMDRPRWFRQGGIALAVSAVAAIVNDAI